MFNISVNDKKNIYRSKPVMNVDTVPKPLTYDYMPEGYPSKSMGLVTLVEEQEVTFTEHGGLTISNSPVDLEIKLGDKLTVVWDGVSYGVEVKKATLDSEEYLVFGNAGLTFPEDTTDYPFVCVELAEVGVSQWATTDTSPTHTIKVMRQQETITPIDANYMPEGYPKKDGWSVEWDGNIDGKINVAGTQIYKFSDRVLSYEEFLSAQYVIYEGGEQDSGMVSKAEPNQTQSADAVSKFACFYGEVQFLVVSEDNAETNGMIFPTKGLYTSEDIAPFKLIKETVTPMDANFIPKNFNVVFSGINNIPTSCNVTYDELRGWIEKGVPVFAIYQYKQDDGSVSSVANVMNVVINTDSLSVYYRDFLGTHNFTYNSDGTFSEGEG